MIQISNGHGVLKFNRKQDLEHAIDILRNSGHLYSKDESIHLCDSLGADERDIVDDEALTICIPDWSYANIIEPITDASKMAVEGQFSFHTIGKTFSFTTWNPMQGIETITKPCELIQKAGVDKSEELYSVYLDALSLPKLDFERLHGEDYHLTLIDFFEDLKEVSALNNANTKTTNTHQYCSTNGKSN